MSTRLSHQTRFWMCGFALLFAVPAFGQPRREPDAFLNQQRALERQIDEERAKLSPVTEDFRFDYGGSYSFFLFMYDDGINSSRTFRRHDLRVWTRLGFDQGAHEIYARGLLSFIDFNSGDEYDDEDDVEGMNLERGFYKFDLQKAMMAYHGERIDYNVELKLGRDLTEFGTGYALSTNLDQVNLRITSGDLQLTGLAAQTVGSSQDFDLFRNPERERRNFWGLEARLTKYERHRPFAYVLWQNDQNSDNRRAFEQNYDYDSFYVGIGSTGELISQLRYSTEFVYEVGTNYGTGATRGKNNIDAWAWDIQLEYLFNVRYRPKVSLEYMFASGDPDRTLSPTDSIGGNPPSNKDSSFVGFGYRDTGLSFAPTLSNIHIWRAGASFFPFEDHDNFKNVELGTNWFLYYKHHGSAAVSDPTATLASNYLGWEMDYFANWPVTPDLAATARYGLFFPGDAFADQTTRYYLLLGLTWNF